MDCALNMLPDCLTACRFSFYLLVPRHTPAYSLLAHAMLMCRFGPPLAFNFMAAIAMPASKLDERESVENTVRCCLLCPRGTRQSLLVLLGPLGMCCRVPECLLDPIYYISSGNATWLIASISVSVAVLRAVSHLEGRAWYDVALMLPVLHAGCTLLCIGQHQLISSGSVLGPHPSSLTGCCPIPKAHYHGYAGLL